MRKERAVIVENVLESGGATASLYLVTGNVVYSRSFTLADVENVGVSYLMTTACISAAATVVFEQSFQPPTTEGTSDVTYKEPLFMSAHVIGLTTTSGVWVHRPLFTALAAKVNLPYGRFKLQGTGWNSGSTILIKLSKQVEG
jgi:hypothetical protein